MNATTYKIGVEITGDDSKFRAMGNRAEKTISDLERKASSDLKKIGGSFAGIVSDKETAGLGQFVGKVGEGTTALSTFAGPAAVASSIIVGIGTAAVSAGAVIFDFSKRTAEAGMEIKRFQTLTGLSAESVTALKYAAETGGKSLETIEEIWESFSELLIEGARGSDNAKERLIRLGVDPKAGMQDLEGTLAKVIKTIGDMPPGLKQNAALMDGFGESGLDMANVVKAMNGDIKGYTKTLKDLGLVLDDEAIRNSQEFDRTLKTLQSQIKGITYTVAREFMPEVTGSMDDVSKYLAENKDDWSEWGDHIADIIRGVKNVLKNEDVSDTRKNLKWLGSSINEYNPAMWGVAALKKSGADSREQDRLKLQYEAETVMPGVTGYGIWKGYAPPSAVTPAKSKYDYSKQLDKEKNKKKSDLSLSFDDLLTAMRTGTKGQESNGNQFARNGRTGASGWFQVLPENIPEWTKNTFGVSMSVEQFKKNASAQIAVFNKYMGEYLKEGLAKAGGNWEEGVRRAAVRWYGTLKNTDDFAEMKRFRKDEPSRGEYTQSVLSRTKRALGDKSAYEMPVLNGALEIGEGAKALADYDNKLKSLGVTTERGRIEIEILAGKYKDLNELQVAQLRLSADTIDNFEISSKAAADYASVVEKLSSDYSDLTQNIPTATQKLDESIRALNAAGVVTDSTSEAYAKFQAWMIDSAKTQEVLAKATQEMIDLRRAERQATWELVYAEQAYRNELAGEIGAKETVIGIAPDTSGYTSAIENAGQPPRLKRKASAFQIGDAAETGGFKKDGVFDQSTVDAQVSMMETLKDVGMDAFGSIAGEIANATANWIAFGDASGQSLGELTANVLASVSAQALATGLMELGIGFAALTPWGAAVYGPAPLHFKSAAILMGIGAAFGGAARIAGSGSGKSGESGEQSKGSSDFLKDEKNEDQKTNFLRSSEKSREQTEYAAEIGRVSDAVQSLTDRIGSMRPGDVLTVGANQKPGFIAERTVSELGKNSTLSNQMGRRLGLD